MKTLNTIVLERSQKQDELSKKTREFEDERRRLSSEIAELSRLEILGCEGLSLQLIQIAEKVISVKGNPYGITSDMSNGHKNIAELAILDIAQGCPSLKKEYYGNKIYGSYYQRCDCKYGYGPSHGSIVDSIELRDRKGDLSEEEKDACIYYLHNYKKIKETTKTK